MAGQKSQRPEAVGKKEGREAGKLAWETPRVIASDAYLTAGSSDGGQDASSLAS
jgi:hypothetical protein